MIWWGGGDSQSRTEIFPERREPRSCVGSCLSSLGASLQIWTWEARLHGWLSQFPSCRSPPPAPTSVATYASLALVSPGLIQTRRLGTQKVDSSCFPQLSIQGQMDSL